MKKKVILNIILLIFAGSSLFGQFEIDSITSTPVSCGGFSDATVTVHLSKGSGLGYIYRLMLGATTWQEETYDSTHTFSTGHTKGENYVVAVFDSINLLISQYVFNIEIDGPDVISILSSTPTDLKCATIDGGKIFVDATGETNHLKYELSGDGTGISYDGNFNNLGKGTYTVTVTDSTEDCPSSAFEAGLIIGAPDTLTVTDDVITDVKCFGDATGAITITADGGTPDGGPYSYFWTGPGISFPSLEDQSGLSAGAYKVVVSDDNLCIVEGNYTVTEANQITIVVNSSDSVLCNGGNDGRVDITVSNGIAPLDFSWDGLSGNPLHVSSIENANNLYADTYRLTIEDDSGCIATFPLDEVTIYEPDPILAVLDSAIDVTCFTYADGKGYISVSGGTGPYDYLWNDPANSTIEDPIDLLPGSYSLDIIDGNLCTVPNFSNLLTIGTPDDITAEVTDSTDVLCYGGSTGTATVIVDKGTPGYTYFWTGNLGHSTTMANPDTLKAETYNLEVTDAQSCVKNFPGIVSIDEPDDITNPYTVTNVDCNDDATGKIDLLPAGGILPFTFAWTGTGVIFDAQNQENLKAGFYDVTVTDANACFKDYNNIQVLENDPITASFLIDSLNCYGSGDGEIAATISGGSGTPYTYHWISDKGYLNDFNEDITGLEAANYTLTVKDDLVCDQTFLNLIVAEPDPLVVAFDSTDASCYDSINGAIDIHITGGTGSYQTDWTGPAFTSSDEDISGLAPGDYTLYLRDHNGCDTTYFDEVTIDEPTEIAISETHRDIACAGENNGSISIVPSEGTPGGYTFQWDGPNSFNETTDEIIGLEPGQYDLTVTDFNGCPKEFLDVATITEPAAIDVTIEDQTNLDCYGINIGDIDISIAGGFSPYSVRWTNSVGTEVSTQQDPSSLSADSYSLEVTDDSSCVVYFSDTVIITQPLKLVFDKADITPATGCGGGNDAILDVNAVGGTIPIQYSIDSTSFLVSGMFTGLIAGDTTAYARDSKGCIIDTTVAITEPAPLIFTLQDTIAAACNGASTGSVIVQASGGTLPYTYTLNPALSPPQVNDGTFINLPAGDYSVDVDDSDPACGQISSLTLKVKEPNPILIDSVLTDFISCNNASDAEISVHISGDTPPYTYSFDNETTYISSSSQTGLGPGTYDVFVKDNNGCSFYIDTYSFIDPNTIIILPILTPVSPCFGETNGAISASASGGWGSFEYSLDSINYQTSGDFFGLPGGDTTLFVRDTGSCLATMNITIIQPTEVTATIVKTDYVDAVLGTISISSPSGGVSPYDYSIYGFDSIFTTTTSYTDLVTGSYDVVVRDDSACPYEETIQIYDIIPLTMVIDSSDVSCFGDDNGFIEFQPQDEVGEVLYSIDNSPPSLTTARFENLPGNTMYILRAIDADGKIYWDSVYIYEPDQLSVSVENLEAATCNAFSEDGTLDITVSGGNGGYIYDWSNGATSEDLVNVVAGNYTVNITDNLGCILSKEIMLPAYNYAIADAGEDIAICQGESIMLDGKPGDIVHWEPASYQINQSIPNPLAVNVTESITYTYIVTETSSPHSCYDIDSMTINILPTVGIDVTQDTVAIDGQSIQLEAIGGPFVSYEWVPSTGLDANDIVDPIAIAEYTIRYWVNATNEYGCIESDSVLIEVIENIKVYNAFSPNNGDDINQYFEIQNAAGFPQMLVEVYNRWGSKVFSSVGYSDDKRWDGTARGKDVPVGTYYYIIIPYSSATPITGNVTIIR